MSLSSLRLRASYRKGRDDIATAFYLPCMAEATRYDRAVGFFRSTIFSIAWASLKRFLENDGTIRILCSPVLDPSDISALVEGYSARLEEQTALKLKAEIETLLTHPVLEKPARVLAALVAMRRLEFRVVYISREAEPHVHRLFHDKLGLFTDSSSNVVAFKGSMNETWSGLSNDGNLESVDVFVSWGGEREAERIGEETAYFEEIWNNEYPTAVVRSIPEAATEGLLRAASPDLLAQLVADICEDIDRRQSRSADRSPGGRILLPHQAAALDEWTRRGRRGILEHATGSGKTYTALSAIREALGRGEVPVVIVPSRLLLGQWLRELRDTLRDLDPQILRCGAGFSAWRTEGLLRPWSRPPSRPRVILTTLATAAGTRFQALLTGGVHLFIVADEVHNLGSSIYRRVLDVASGPRLGLSATPRRAGDPVGTSAIMEYFSGVVPPPFLLRDGIASGVLTPYFYYVHLVTLTEAEQKEWARITGEIALAVARSGTDDQGLRQLPDRVKLLAIERARIVKRAAAKTPLAGDVLWAEYKLGERWLVYCESMTQLWQVLTTLQRRGLPAREYHSAMAGNREATLREFELNGGILVAIKCLDEGVDIPLADHALILASSQNPREFIQRRGRVLRRAHGKSLAHIHDALVMPLQLEGQPDPVRVLEAELARALEFGRSADNPACVADLERIALRYGIVVDQVIEQGVESDEEVEADE